MKAILRRARISDKKANLVAGLVRGKKVTEALAILKFTPKKAAKLLYKVVESAAANAKNNFKQPFADLFITRLIVTKGPTYKRSLPISRGRTHPIRKRTCHITVEVGVMGDATSPAVEKLVEKKVTELKAEKAEKPAKGGSASGGKVTAKKAKSASGAAPAAKASATKKPAAKKKTK